MDEVIDADGKYVIPGGVDIHTHFNLHVGNTIANDDFYTGTIAAACGGTTTIVDHMGFGPVGCNLKHQINVYHKYADENDCFILQDACATLGMKINDKHKIEHNIRH